MKTTTYTYHHALMRLIHHLLQLDNTLTPGNRLRITIGTDGAITTAVRTMGEDGNRHRARIRITDVMTAAGMRSAIHQIRTELHTLHLIK